MNINSHIKINENVELLHLDNRYLAHNNEYNILLTFNQSTWKILKLIDGEEITLKEFYDLLNIKDEIKKEKLKEFLMQLYDKKILKVDNLESDTSTKKKAYMYSLDLPINFNFSWIKQNKNFLSVNSNFNFFLILLLFLLTIYLSVITLKANYIYIYGLQNINFVVVITILLLHIIVHEFSHAYMVLKHGARLKSIGIGLLYYFLPSAFIKYQGKFKLPYDSQTIISLIGPIVDSCLIMISILLFNISEFKELFYLIILYQTTFLLFNCNPLMPSDLLKGIESYLKIPNIRKTSKEVVFHNFKNKDISTLKIIIYHLYFFMCILYLIVILFFLTMNIFYFIKG